MPLLWFESMKTDAIRVAIAQFCGWKDVGLYHPWTERFLEEYSPDFKIVAYLRGRPPGKNYPDFLPNYTQDLNAMNEAERFLENIQVLDYQKELENIIKNRCRVCDASTYSSDFIFHSCAKDRAEAFVKTIGKWIP
jgi:hypothetical protein